MKPRLPSALSATVMALAFWLTTLLFAPSIAMAQETFVIKPVADKKLKELPAGPLYLARR